jgi:hypothetical protein
MVENASKFLDSLPCKWFKFAHGAQILRVSFRNLQTCSELRRPNGTVKTGGRFPGLKSGRQEGRKRIDRWMFRKSSILLPFLRAFLICVLGNRHALLVGVGFCRTRAIRGPFSCPCIPAAGSARFIDQPDRM